MQKHVLQLMDHSRESEVLLMKTKTEDAARLSEGSRPICHTPSVSGFTSDQGMNHNEEVQKVFVYIS